MKVEDSSSKCYYHPDRGATSTCVYCGKSVCAECSVTLSDKCYCKPCADVAFAESAARPARIPSWFERHLNWTTVLTWVGAVIISFVAGFVVGVTMYGSDIVRTETVAAFAGYIAALAWLLVTNGWVLRKKGRSEWHLLLLLVPLGFLFLLAVENKTQTTTPARPPSA